MPVEVAASLTLPVMVPSRVNMPFPVPVDVSVELEESSAAQVGRMPPAANNGSNRIITRMMPVDSLIGKIRIMYVDMYVGKEPKESIQYRRYGYKEKESVKSKGWNGWRKKKVDAEFST